MTLRLFAILILSASLPLAGAETDQFLTWEIELEDSAPAFNTYLNTELTQFLEHVNRRSRPIEDPEALTQECYFHFFQGLHASRIRKFCFESSAVDRYPDKMVSFFKYQQMSIFRKPAFPYILPMARTIRLGEVYLGIDKIGHFFGFGRRYYQRYCRHRAEGLSEQAAREQIITWGISHELNFVGKLVDGIFSHADMEANYQGFRMACDLCGGDRPYLRRNDAGLWEQCRPINICDYVTPDLDESYNCCHYWALRERNVLPILREEYCVKLDSPIVQARFKRYAAYAPSFSKTYIDAYFDAKKINPQREQEIFALCASQDDRPPAPQARRSDPDEAPTLTP